MRNLSLIYNNLIRRRGQTLITVLIIAMTIFIFTLIFGTMMVINDGMRISKEKLGADLVVIPKYASVENRELLFTASPENIYMPNHVLDEVKELKGIKRITAQFFSQTLQLSCCSPGEEVRIVGFDPETDFILSPHLKSDEDFSNSDDLVLGSNFDENLLGTKYLILGGSFNVKNQVKPTGTGMDNTIFLNIDTLREITAKSLLAEKLWKDKNPADYISTILVKLEDGFDPQDFIKSLEDKGIDAKVVLTGDTISNIQRQMQTTMLMLVLIWIGSLIITILSLFGRFNSLANMRKKEIGLLRALGFRKSQVFLQIFGECSIMALLGGLLGSFAAILLMNPIIDLIKSAFTVTPTVWGTKAALLSLFVGSGLSLIIGFIASFYPAHKSSRLDPQAAITQGEI